MSYETLSDFDYPLPECLIAKRPLKERSSSRLLCVDGTQDTINHHFFNDIEFILEPKDLLVMNDTKVIPARLYGYKETGGKVECLVERILSSQKVLAHIKASKAPTVGCELRLAGVLCVVVTQRVGDLFELQFDTETSVLETLFEYGEIPLPPYMERQPDTDDLERYQTVYANKVGAVAAPTAGLHFDEPLLTRLKARGVEVATVTLHVGAGTFQPVRVEQLDDHIMHREWMEVSETLCQKVRACRQQGGRVVAVGTTSVRCLETAALGDEIQAFQGDTNLFIRPGYSFRCVDLLITNFHLPCSTLLMLVTAFGGYDSVMRAYREAIKKEYRFYSYGDAMLIYKK